MKKRTRMEPQARRSKVLKAAVKLALRHGYQHITRDGIGKAAGVPYSLVSYHLGPMRDIRRAVMQCAVSQGIVEIVAQGIAVNDPVALGAPVDLKLQAAAVLTEKIFD